MPATALRPMSTATTTTLTTDSPARVVRDATGRVVLICWGADSAAEVAAWARLGYHVDAIDRRTLSA